MIKTRHLMSAAVLAAMVPVCAQAQEGTNAGPDKPSASSPAALGVERSALAAQLASYGRAESSPVALMLAGQIAAQVGGTEEARTKAQEGTAAAESGTKQGTARPVTAQALFAEAKALAGSDKALVARIDRAASRQSKGEASGNPVRHTDSVNAGITDVYNISFRGGAPARVAVLGDGDTDLDLRVYDSNNNLICSDTDYTDKTYCSWTPAWTGNFKVKIQNLGRVYNRYTLLTN